MSEISNKDRFIGLILDNPLEPVVANLEGNGVKLIIPKSYYRMEHANVIPKTGNAVIENEIVLPELVEKPDLSFAENIKMDQALSLFNEKHQSIAGRLVSLFLNAKDFTEFMALGVYVKDRVNSELFVYVLTSAIQYHKDTKNIKVKSIATLFPRKFIAPSVFRKAREIAALHDDSMRREIVEIPVNYTASDRDEEQRLSYYREDIGMNSHHWHWHLVYPDKNSDNPEIVNKDRRGELFYYMHHQMIARYNIERFCNKLSKVRPMTDLRDAIHEGYFPKILSGSTSRTFPHRAHNSMLSDLDRSDVKYSLADLRRYTDRIVAAIDNGYVVNADGKHITLDAQNGIDILGNIIEASQLSVNRSYYGNMHNSVHMFIAYCHDPEEKFLEDIGVMGDSTTAARDPVFYRLHSFVDNMFIRFKNTLPAYKDDELKFNNINIADLTLHSNKSDEDVNVLQTYLDKSKIDLKAGLDFSPKGDIVAIYTHLQHEEFEYRIKVVNNSTAAKKGTVRIFLLPKSDERNIDLNINEKRLLAIELDRFIADIAPGESVLARKSTESSVTMPFDDEYSKITENYCHCGWPHHLLLPKGNTGGMPFELFIMISDYSADAVLDESNGSQPCKDASSFCGLKDKKYPDKRSMGFPFDRAMPQQVKKLHDLADSYANMYVKQIHINHHHEYINGGVTSGNK